MKNRSLAAIGYAAAIAVFLAAAWQGPVKIEKTDRLKEVRTSFLSDRFAGPATGNITTD